MALTKPQSRDGNEPLIIALYRAMSCAVEQMDKTAGFDLLVAKDAVHVVEVKRTHKSPLTGNEAALKSNLERAGARFNIVVTPFEALAMLGYTLEEISINRLWLMMDTMGADKIKLDVDLLAMQAEFLAAVGDEIARRHR